MSLSFVGGKFATTFSGGGGGGNASLEWISLMDNASSIIGYLANQYNLTGQLNTIIGYQAASDPLSVSGDYNLIVGSYAGFRNQGDYNTWLGTKAGMSNLNGSQNVAVGYNAGSTLVSSRGNSVLGFESGMASTGDGNTHVGFRSGSEGTMGITDSNVSVGARSYATGGRSVAIGPGAKATGAASMALGPGSSVSGLNTILLAPNATATACNSLILMPRRDGLCSSHTTPEELNVYGVMLGQREATGAYAVNIESDKLMLNNRVNRIGLSPIGIEVYSEKSTTFLTPVNFNYPATFTEPVTMSEDLVLSGGLRVPLGISFFDDRVVFNGPVTFNSNVFMAALTVDSATAKRLVVTESASFSNRARFFGPTVFSGDTTVSDDLVVSGSLAVGRDIAAPLARIDRALVSYLSASNLTASNGSFGDLFGSNVSSLANTSVSYAGERARFGTADVSNLSASNLGVAVDAKIGRNLAVAGVADVGTLVVGSNASVGGALSWTNPDGDSLWTIKLDYSYTPCNNYADLAFKSKKGASFVLNDNFVPGILNFTGKHRCSARGFDSLEPGTLVVTTGEFAGLDGQRGPTVDEAIPVVRPCDAERDPRAFGVVAGYEEDGPRRIYRLANAVFGYDKADPADRKVIVNSVGEGGMWVCDANGVPRNGDLVTTSSVQGHGQKQDDDVVRSYTVAKVTGDVVAWEPYVDAASRKTCLRSFVGVTYKF